MSSYIYPITFFSSTWYSIANLHPIWHDSCRIEKALSFSGGGWSPNKEEGQVKALVEGVERWVLRYFSLYKPFADAGVDIDSTSNGFSAIPSYMNRIEGVKHSYFEALERWVLNRFWNRGDILFQEVSLTLVEKIKERKLFHNFEGNLKVFYCSLKTKELKHLKLSSQSAIFYLALFFPKQEGHFFGVIPGSACGDQDIPTIRRAILEAFIHTKTYFEMKLGQTNIGNSITEKRLLYFGDLKDAVKEIYQKMNVGENGVKNRKVNSLETPSIIFEKELYGPWNPEVSSFRVLVEESPPINDNNIKRFLI